ncbi:MAG: histidine kinase [Acidobacteriota bacterium]
MFSRLVSRERPGSFWAWRPQGVMLVLTFAVVVALPITAIHAFYRPIDLTAYLTIVLVGTGYGLGYLAVFRWGLPRLLRDVAGPSWRAVFLGGLGIIAASLFGGVSTALTLEVMGWQADNHWLVGSGIILIVRLFHLDFERLEDRVEDVELREERARHRAARAQLDALAARVDPHFLFNTLNVLAGLVEEDPPRAVEMINRLSRLYQHTLVASRADRVSLADELHAVSSYLEVQALRFEGRITYRVDCDPDLEGVLVPPLCVQPLVENAVLHGTSVTESSCSIEVCAERVADGMRIRVDDDGPGPGGSRHQGNGTALEDLEARLALATEGHARLVVGAREPRGFRAEIELAV